MGSQRSALLSAVLVLAALAGPAASAAAAPPPDRGRLLVTLAARSCPSYTDITANLARNNIMESLRDLGPNTPYKHGEPVDPEVEERVQPKCKPLPGWRFSLGDGYRTRAVTGPWGALSIVRNEVGKKIVTEDSTPLLDARGDPTGKKIAGATTIELGEREAALAARASLWVQGGTADDPILKVPFPDPRFGFGALRCAIDNVNGDNVEYVSYPVGTTHVFCFAYYVEPPPTSGTIVIRKEALGAGAAAETFNFDGNLSYNPGGRFSLQPRDGKVASETFFRGATGKHEPWTVRELGAVDWRLEDLACSSRDGTSEVETSLAAGTAKITLGAEDLVTCTYRDQYSPPPQGLLIRKLTEGGVGRFGYSVEPLGGGEMVEATATTAEEGVAVDADPSPLALAPGRYRVAEEAPEVGTGHWRLASAECGGEPVPVEGPIEVTVSARELTGCTFTNRFVPKGSITISKVTRGGTGTSGFQIAPASDPAAVLQQSATTVAPDRPSFAHGDASDHLALGSYTILDSPPQPHGGEWRLAEVECDGRVLPSSEGRIEVALTVEDPHVHCTFVNAFDPRPEPPSPPAATASTDPTPVANLIVTKVVTTRKPRADETIAYEITVRNAGPDVAAQVSAVDQPLGEVRIVSVRASQGSCAERLPIICDLGDLAPGAVATVRVRLIAPRPGTLVNRAVADTASEELEVKSAEDEAPIRLRPARTSSPPEPGLG